MKYVFSIRHVELKNFALLAVVMLFSPMVSGQVSIKGRILSKSGEALSRINVIVYPPKMNTMIAFAISDDNGYFEVKVNSKTDSVVLKTSSISYRNESRTVPNVSQNLQFVLIDDVKQLEGISVIASPIIKRGDTLSYLVTSFAKREDRAIEDVLRRMPGIEVQDDGKIMYQGIPINKFYVEGLDLMEGRYTIVSKNLPKGSVGSVEILENHQPMRMLQDKVETQEAALNLKLKKGITTTGVAQLGVGYNPFLWNVNVTPMTFTKNYQFVSSLQSNNTGNDLSEQLNVYTYEDLKNASERPTIPVEMLNVMAASPPDIKTERYLDNKAIILNFNGLQHITPEFTLRTNLYYSYDEQQSYTSVIRTIYTPNDTLKFSEHQDNQLNSNNLYAKFNINRNVKRNYLNDDLAIQSGWDTHGGAVQTQGEKIVQTLQNPLRSFSNDLKSLNPLGEHIWEFRSAISYDHSPHQLTVTPGQFEDVLNDSVHYDMATQKIDLKRFFTDNSTGFVFGFNRITVSPRVGLSYFQQSLTSNISLQQNDKETTLDSRFSNAIESKHLQGYLLTNIEYKLPKLTFNGSITLKSNHLEAADIKSANDQEITKIIAEYRVSADYKITGFWRIYSSWGNREQISNFDEMYSGYIMKNCRNLSQNMVPLSITSSQIVSSRIEYRNQIISFFNTLSYMYSVSRSANTSSNWINPDGSTIVTNQNIAQVSNSQFLQAYSSKFFSAVKTTISFRLNLFQQKGASVVNAKSLNSENRMILLKPDLSIHFTPWMNMSYSMDANTILTLIDEQEKSRISLIKHKVGFFFFSTKNQLINFSSEYYRHNDVNNLFVDMMYRYTFTKRKVDIEVKCNNIFNSGTYTSFLANAYSVSETTYLLRPFQVISSIKFNF